MDDRPWPYWLRRFYWFENSIWRLNEIKDFDPSSFDTTKMEFIKVQDCYINDYNRLSLIKEHGDSISSRCGLPLSISLPWSSHTA